MGQNGGLLSGLLMLAAFAALVAIMLVFAGVGHWR